MNTTLQPKATTRLRKIASRLLYLPICIATSWIAACISSRYFQFDYSALGILSTALILAVFFAALAPALRGPVAGSCLSFLAALLLLTGHAVKIAAMKTPLQIADIATIPLLFRTLTGLISSSASSWQARR